MKAHTKDKSMARWSDISLFFFFILAFYCYFDRWMDGRKDGWIATKMESKKKKERKMVFGKLCHIDVVAVVGQLVAKRKEK